MNGLAQEELAFDHAAIIERSIEYVERVDASSIAASLVPATFTIQELRHVHTLLGGKLQDRDTTCAILDGVYSFGQPLEPAVQQFETGARAIAHRLTHAVGAGRPARLRRARRVSASR